MRTTSGIFRWRVDAERASRMLRTTGLGNDRITLLVPGDASEQARRVPLSTTEQPGVGQALGAVTGAAIGLASAFELDAVISSAIMSVGPITVMGFCGITILGLLGAAMGAAVGSALDHAMTDGLPADEWFVYEDALRKGRSVVLAFPDSHDATEFARNLLAAEGAESIDEGRKQWWIGLRSAELEHYSLPVLVAPASPGNDEGIPFIGKESWHLQAGARRAPRILGKERKVKAP